MRALTISELIDATGGVPSGIDDLNRLITRIETDSRQVKPGDLFWALEGQNHDGHDFVEEALRRGAILAVVEEDRCAAPSCVVVKDSLMALWDFAEWYRREHDALIIGVTGSVGKTTTRRMIAAVLSSKFRGIQSPRNYNNQFGVPLSLLQLSADHDFGVFELGASQVGEIADLAEVARPEIGVITAIGPSHLEEFGAYEAIIETKAGLLDKLPPEGFAVLNGDDRNVRNLASRAPCPVILVGEKSHNTLLATDVAVENHQLTFSVNDDRFCVPASGRHHLTAALIAIAIGRHIDMTAAEIQRGLDTFQPESGRCEVLQMGDWTVINDTYNANPISMSAACRTLKDWQTTGKKILLIGDMLSLGEWSHDFHHLLGQEITRSAIDRVIAYGPQAAIVAGSAKKNGMDAGCLGVCRDAETVRLLLDLWLGPQDVILLKGSRGMKMEQFLTEVQRLTEVRRQVKLPDEQLGDPSRKVA